jgi:hypothetical protein
MFLVVLEITAILCMSFALQYAIVECLKTRGELQRLKTLKAKYSQLLTDIADLASRRSSWNREDIIQTAAMLHLRITQYQSEHCRVRSEFTDKASAEILYKKLLEAIISDSAPHRIHA